MSSDRACGASIFEEGNFASDGFRYQTVMVNTCQDKTVLFTLYMNALEWYYVEHFYTKYDEFSEEP